MLTHQSTLLPFCFSCRAFPSLFLAAISFHFSGLPVKWHVRKEINKEEKEYRNMKIIYSCIIKVVKEMVDRRESDSYHHKQAGETEV